MSEYSVILFFSNNYTVFASNVLTKNGIVHKMIPVPRHLSSECGYAVRIISSETETIRDLMVTAGVQFERIENL